MQQNIQFKKRSKIQLHGDKLLNSNKIFLRNENL